MKKPQIRRIIPHFVQDEQRLSLSDRIADLHIQVIERSLNQSELSTAQKLTVIDQIIENLRTGEVQYISQ